MPGASLKANVGGMLGIGQAKAGAAVQGQGLIAVPFPGETNAYVMLLVIAEVLALVALRRYFRTAHGG